MILLKDLFIKRFTQLAVLLLLATSMIPLTAQATLAIPLKPILDRIGLRMLEGVFNVDSATQPFTPATQPFTPASSPGSPSATSGSLPPTSQPSMPANQPSPYPVPPMSPPSASPQGDPAHPPYSVPTPPVYSAPTYPPAYQVNPPRSGSPIIIINN